MSRYRPRFYPGEIKCIVPEIKSDFLPRNAFAAWKNLAAKRGVDTVPGDHMEMVNLHYASLASILTRYIQEAALDCARAK
jgi:hypothetical protein